MGYPVTNTLSTPLSRVSYLTRNDLGPNMRCFVCKKETVTMYKGQSVVKYCYRCEWESHPVKIPEAIR